MSTRWIFLGARVLVNEPASWFFFLLLSSRTKPIKEFLVRFITGWINTERCSNEWNKENQPLDIFHCAAAHHTVTVFVFVSILQKRKFWYLEKGQWSLLRSFDLCLLHYATRVSPFLPLTHTCFLSFSPLSFFVIET